MQPPFPAPVPAWHNDVYPAIDPTNHPNSHKGKTVIITGAVRGVIGRATALAFATAGTSHLVLIGRTTSTLEETASKITGNTRVSIFVADATDEAAVKKIADALDGTWDVLVLNAAYISTPSPIVSSDVDDYWKSYETNVKPALLFAKHFFPKANPNGGAAVLAVTSGAMILPIKMLPPVSAYQNSKLALVKTMEYLAHENPGVFCASVHPGMVDTCIFRKSGATPDMLPMDNPNGGFFFARLPAAFMVWMTLPEARFLNGKFVFANWDVDELKEKAEEISSGDRLTAGILGWPFKHVSSGGEA